MPFLPGDIPIATFALGLTEQNYHQLMGQAGLLCGFVVMLFFSKAL